MVMPTTMAKSNATSSATQMGAVTTKLLDELFHEYLRISSSVGYSSISQAVTKYFTSTDVKNISHSHQPSKPLQFPTTSVTCRSSKAYSLMPSAMKSNSYGSGASVTSSLMSYNLSYVSKLPPTSSFIQRFSLNSQEHHKPSISASSVIFLSDTGSLSVSSYLPHSYTYALSSILPYQINHSQIKSTHSSINIIQTTSLIRNASASQHETRLHTQSNITFSNIMKVTSSIHHTVSILTTQISSVKTEFVNSTHSPKFVLHFNTMTNLKDQPKPSPVTPSSTYHSSFLPSTSMESVSKTSPFKDFTKANGVHGHASVSPTKRSLVSQTILMTMIANGNVDIERKNSQVKGNLLYLFGSLHSTL